MPSANHEPFVGGSVAARTADGSVSGRLVEALGRVGDEVSLDKAVEAGAPLGSNGRRRSGGALRQANAAKTTVNDKKEREKFVHGILDKVEGDANRGASSPPHLLAMSRFGKLEVTGSDQEGKSTPRAQCSTATRSSWTGVDAAGSRPNLRVLTSSTSSNGDSAGEKVGSTRPAKMTVRFPWRFARVASEPGPLP